MHAVVGEVADEHAAVADPPDRVGVGLGRPDIGDGEGQPPDLDSVARRHDRVRERPVLGPGVAHHRSDDGVLLGVVPPDHGVDGRGGVDRDVEPVEQLDGAGVVVGMRVGDDQAGDGPARLVDGRPHLAGVGHGQLPVDDHQRLGPVDDVRVHRHDVTLDAVDAQVLIRGEGFHVVIGPRTVMCDQYAPPGAYPVVWRTGVDMADAPTYQCPVDASLEVLGGKWKLTLVFYLLQQPRRNGELRRLIPAITQKVLTQQLRELEADGIVTRTVHDQVPPKVVYAVGDRERARLQPVVDALSDWGLYWCDKTGARILALERSAADGVG